MRNETEDKEKTINKINSDLAAKINDVIEKGKIVAGLKKYSLNKHDEFMKENSEEITKLSQSLDKKRKEVKEKDKKLTHIIKDLEYERKASKIKDQRMIQLTKDLDEKIKELNEKENKINGKDIDKKESKEKVKKVKKIQLKSCGVPEISYSFYLVKRYHLCLIWHLPPSPVVWNRVNLLPKSD